MFYSSFFLFHLLLVLNIYIYFYHIRQHCKSVDCRNIFVTKFGTSDSYQKACIFRFNESFCEYKYIKILATD